ncbi:MAG: class I SAM-dependent RNA methyltransferase [Ardenticatenaceae bacterium]|nr:class I SAM-dependent RNA methyltransferase [Ardenticatenaceae bacterium]MCB8975741.1 class I SAM-dependent RNA methyltransferase [Ardenticatenaceae bacterium]
MEKVTLDITEMAHGGSGIGRANRSRTVFVPLTVPGEKVRAQIVSEKNKYAQAELVQVLQPSPERVTPRCQHFAVCGGCHFQHMSYGAQLAAKEAVVRDQLARLGGFKQANVVPVLPNPEPWAYRVEMVLSPVGNGRLGFWSPVQKEVIAIEECPIARPELVGLLQDVELDLPGLRKLSLRVGDDEALLAAIEVDGVEPPELEADFPISVAIVLPDKTAASLVGDFYSVQRINGRDFRISPGVDMAGSPAGMELVVQTVLRYAMLTGEENVVELYSGAGTLTAFLAEKSAEVVAVERNPDAVADLAVNLDDLDNVNLFEGEVEDVLPLMPEEVEVMVAHPWGNGLSKKAVTAVSQAKPARFIYVSSDVATLARDGRSLAKAGYNLVEIQPIDMQPQTFHIETVSLWERA